MKNNRGITLLIIGIIFTILGLTILSDHQILKYSSLILGLVISIYSVFVSDKWKKKLRQMNQKDSTE